MTENSIQKNESDKCIRPHILVAYCGRYTERIGPPKSMRALANLLHSIGDVSTTTNLNVNTCKEKIVSGRVVSKSKFTGIARTSQSGRWISLVYLALHMLKFNWEIFLYCWSRESAVVVVTQPFVFPCILRSGTRLIYIRRANRDITCILGDSRLKRSVERKFYERCKFDLVFLVPNDSSVSASVIPNHFNLKDFVLRISDSEEDIAKVYWVGTWDLRKGADRLKLVMEVNERRVPVNIFGGLGTDLEVNRWLNASNYVNYHGVMERPYERFNVGDIFITLSYLEGFQRAMVESMLMGCLVVAVARPDTINLKDIPGVYLVDWNDKEPVASAKTFGSAMFKFTRMSADERVKLGLLNREYMAKAVSEESVLERWSIMLKS